MQKRLSPSILEELVEHESPEWKQTKAKRRFYFNQLSKIIEALQENKEIQLWKLVRLRKAS
jgi:hypothetical protein